MNGITIILISAVVLIIGYLGYGRWLAKSWGVDPEVLTPAVRMEDGKDFSPAQRFSVFAHQFSSICGAGPVTGTIVAMMFGWLPVLLWVLVGGIFFGAVHDFGALYASVKNDGKSMGMLIEKYIGKTGRKLFLLFCWLFCGIVIAAFVILQILNAGGLLSPSLQGQLVPICAYVTMAIALNLVVGISGELSLGHAGFMSVGAFSGVVVSLSLQQAIPSGPVRLAVAMLVGKGISGGDWGAEFSLLKIVAWQQHSGSLGFNPAMIPALLAYLIFLPGTMGVAPFDIPEAETEIIEGPLLEYGGPLLALFQVTAALKTFVVLGLGVALFFPGTISEWWPVNLLWFVLKCLGLMLVSLTLVKSATGRFRIDQAFRFYVTVPTALALCSLILVWVM